MAGRRSRNRRKATQGGGTERTAVRLNAATKSGSELVKHAAALLDEELAAGIVAAKKVQQRLRRERRIEPEDFRTALEKFQRDAHEVVNVANDRLSEMRSDQNFAVVKRLVNHTHSLVDLAVELVNTSAELANDLAKSKSSKPTRKATPIRKS